MSVGSNIKKFRELKDRELRNRGEKGLGVNELARRVGVTGTYISGLENDKKENPSMDVLRKIAEALNVKLVDLLQDEDVNLINAEDLSSELKDLNVEYVALAKEFMESDLSVEEIRRIIAAVKATKEIKE